MGGVGGWIGLSLMRHLLLLCLAFAGFASAQNTDPFPTPPNVKGIQVQMTDDALAAVFAADMARIREAIRAVALDGQPTSAAAEAAPA